MNRRHSAYCLVGSAMRFGVMTGLHLNVPQHLMPSFEQREHRKRLWWTAYTLDRIWACMLGKPVSIQDDDIEIDLPSNVQDSLAEDFQGTNYHCASLRIANLGAEITASVYSRRGAGSIFSDRVQQALRELGNWLQNLPEPLRTMMSELPYNAALPTITLYLYFNQVCSFPT